MFFEFWGTTDYGQTELQSLRQVTLVRAMLLPSGKAGLNVMVQTQLFCSVCSVVPFVLRACPIFGNTLFPVTYSRSLISVDRYPTPPGSLILMWL